MIRDLSKSNFNSEGGPAVPQQAEGSAGQGLRADDSPACGEREEGASRMSGLQG